MIKKNNKEVGFIYKPILPDEYQRVEYVESSGTQYIDTGIYATNNSRIVAEFYAYDTYNGAGNRMIGVQDSSVWFRFGTSISGYFIFRYGNQTQNITASLTTGTYEKYKIDLNKNHFTIIRNNVSYGYTFNEQSFISSSYIRLFGVSPTVTDYKNQRMIKCQIYDNNVLVRDLIPCYRKSDNVIGMYDLVEKKFYTNDGKGTFTKGNDVGTANIDKIYHGTDLVFEQGFTREQTGVPPITTNYQAIGKDLKDYKIYGQSIQNGTPTPSVPIEIQSVGDLITDSGDINYGKYKIPVTVSGKNLFNPQIFIDGGATLQEDGSYYFANAYGNDGRVLWENTENYTGRLGLRLTVKYGTANSRGLFMVIKYTDNTTEQFYRMTTEYREIYTLTTSNKVVEKIYLDWGSRNVSTNFLNFQIEKNSTEVTPYEPYQTPSTTNIYLNEPLRKVGDYADYIDFENQKVYRNVIVNDDSGTLPIDQSYSGTTDITGTSIDLPSIPSYKGITIYSVDTTIQPSNMYIMYKSR